MAQKSAQIWGFLGPLKTLLFADRFFPESVTPDFLIRRSAIPGIFVKTGIFWSLRTPIFPGSQDSVPRRRPPKQGPKKGLIWAKIPKMGKTAQNGLCVHLFFCGILDLDMNLLSQETIERERCILYMNSLEIRSYFSGNRIFAKKIDVRKGQKSPFLSNRRFRSKKASFYLVIFNFS